MRVHVADTGGGILDDQVPAVFERVLRIESSRVSSDGVQRPQPNEARA